MMRNRAPWRLLLVLLNTNFVAMNEGWSSRLNIIYMVIFLIKSKFQ
jgi:hypothetical protein